MSFKSKYLPTIAVTLGDPTGIGPEIVKKALSDRNLASKARWKIFGIRGCHPERKRRIPREASWDSSPPLADQNDRLLTPKEAGQSSWKALDQAVASLKKGECDALVTAPVSKTHLKLAGFPFPGQTEYLADQFKDTEYSPHPSRASGCPFSLFQKHKGHGERFVRRESVEPQRKQPLFMGYHTPVMMLASSRLRVVLVTIHIPLKKIFSVLTSQKIFETICITHQSLKKDFGIVKPRLAVCGLNPHAGEAGLMGNEEKKIILPAVLKARKQGMIVSDPLPPDTVFHFASQGAYDVVVCHYHDQGAIPLKTLDFFEGVNITLGLPIIRTSPDHGCAFDIAGKGIADPASQKAAMNRALEICRNRLKVFHE